MQGRVAGLRVQLKVTFRLVSGLNKVIDYVVDTGFEGALTLPAADIADLGLVRVQSTDATLADGSQISMEVYKAVILWHGVEVNVAVFAMESIPLLGAALLQGSYLFVDWMDNGEVRIDPRF